MRESKLKGQKKQRGQAMTEYIMIVALIAIASIALVTIFGNQIREIFSASTQTLQGTQTDPGSAGDPTGEVSKGINDF